MVRVEVMVIDNVRVISGVMVRVGASVMVRVRVGG